MRDEVSTMARQAEALQQTKLEILETELEIEKTQAAAVRAGLLSHQRQATNLQNHRKCVSSLKQVWEPMLKGFLQSLAPPQTQPFYVSNRSETSTFMLSGISKWCN